MKERLSLSRRVSREVRIVRALAPSARYHARMVVVGLWVGVMALAGAMLLHSKVGFVVSVAACVVAELVFLVRRRLWKRYLGAVTSGKAWWRQQRVDVVALLGGFNYNQLRARAGEALAEAVFSDENLLGTAYGLVVGWPAGDPDVSDEMLGVYDLFRDVGEEYSGVLGLASEACIRCSDEEHRGVAVLGVTKCAELVTWAASSPERLSSLTKFVTLAVRSIERENTWQEVLAQYDRVGGTVKVLETA